MVSVSIIDDPCMQFNLMAISFLDDLESHIPVGQILEVENFYLCAQISQ
jgi:hypothetical protein